MISRLLRKVCKSNTGLVII